MWVDTQEIVISEGNLAVLRQIKYKYVLWPSPGYVDVREIHAQVCSGDTFRDAHLDTVYDNEEHRYDTG